MLSRTDSTRRLLRAYYGLLGVIAFLTLSACGGSSGPAAKTPPSDVTLTVVNFRFEPASITVDTNENVTLEVTNSAVIEHTFTSTDLGVDQDVPPQETDEVKFTAPAAAGTVNFGCSIHKEMKGTVVVIDPADPAQPSFTGTAG